MQEGNWKIVVTRNGKAESALFKNSFFDIQPNGVLTIHKSAANPDDMTWVIDRPLYTFPILAMFAPGTWLEVVRIEG